MAAGLALTASVGMSSAATAGAASPALHIKQGSKWSASASAECFEILTFASSGTFTGSRGHDKGTWSGGGPQLVLTWTAGERDGLVFNLTFSKTPIKGYRGTYTFQGATGAAQLVKGTETGC